MTAIEKAKELINKFYRSNIVIEGKYSNYNGLLYKDAKQCAIIVVDEILLIKPLNKWDLVFWQEVRNELNKL
ncbi:MAG TPA: hypothetical protein VIK86_05495 [Candidatus Paceibacterota bacterium]